MTKPAPGFERPVGMPDRPGIGGNRPGLGWNRPDGWNRPGIGDNNIWNSGNVINNINNNHNNWFSNNNQININNRPGGWNHGWNHGGYGGWNGGAWGLPGYGHGGGWYGGYGNWGNRWYDRCVNPGYAGWYHGCWNGNWGGSYGGWWAPFLFGAATVGLASTCANWGLGYGCLGYGATGYVNPYYASVPAAVVAASPYDYSQPIVVNNYITDDGEPAGAGAAAEGGEAAAAPKADPTVERALADFKNGAYDAALAGLDKAVKASPKDSVLHEVRALALFAIGRYDEAAAALNAVLAAAPGMDWTTMSGLYGSVDDYTTQLRRLEAFCKANPGNAAGYFVLAYHYLVGGHADLAADALKVVVAKQPGDLVAKRLLDAITPPPEEPEAETDAKTEAKPEAPPDAGSKPPDAGTAGADPAGKAAAGPETDLVGTWKASMGEDTVELTVKEDFSFIWRAIPKGKAPVDLSGTMSTSADAISLESEKAGTMLAKVKSQGPDAFEFALVGAPKDAQPLVFRRQK